MIFDDLEYLLHWLADREITANWLLNQMLPEGKGELKITEIDNELVIDFLDRLHGSSLFMPDGRHSLVWLKERLELRLSQAEGQRTEKWERVRVRLRYILAKIDMLLAVMKPEELIPPPDPDQGDSGLIVETEP